MLASAGRIGRVKVLLMAVRRGLIGLWMLREVHIFMRGRYVLP